MTPLPFSTGASGSSYTSTYISTYIPIMPLSLSGGRVFSFSPSSSSSLGASLGKRWLISIGERECGRPRGVPPLPPPSCPLVRLHWRSSVKKLFAAQPILFFSSLTMTGDRGCCLSGHRTSDFFVLQRSVAASSHPHLIFRM